ncbi:MAG: metal ABC transporter substrate-binding protein, partial [Acidimicrobiaceae bacterium]|nr:metal ABC transporter substrate-binding protein [Acidimicrobiaceae bacterium]
EVDGQDHDAVDEDDHGHEETGGEVDDHGHEAGDPHVWFDPQRVKETLSELQQLAVEHVGLDSDAVASCLNDYSSELDSLDAEISALLGQIPESNRKLITNHDALAYFADRYEFEIVGTVIPSTSTMAETNPAQLAELAEVIEHEGVPAIFAENLHNSDDAEVLAARVGAVEVVTLYTGSLGPAGSGAEDYLGFMRTNAQLITDALT